MLYRIEAGLFPQLDDTIGRKTAASIREALGIPVRGVRTVKVFTLEGLDAQQQRARRLAPDARKNGWSTCHDPQRLLADGPSCEKRQSGSSKAWRPFADGPALANGQGGKSGSPQTAPVSLKWKDSALFFPGGTVYLLAHG